MLKPGAEVPGKHTRKAMETRLGNQVAKYSINQNLVMLIGSSNHFLD